jgi:hypothetical protein
MNTVVLHQQNSSDFLPMASTHSLANQPSPTASGRRSGALMTSVGVGPCWKYKSVAVPSMSRLILLLPFSQIVAATNHSRVLHVGSSFEKALIIRRLAYLSDYGNTHYKAYSDQQSKQSQCKLPDLPEHSTGSLRPGQNGMDFLWTRAHLWCAVQQRSVAGILIIRNSWK